MAPRHYDLVDFTKKYKGDSHSFYLNVGNWSKFKTRYKLEWQKCRFTKANHNAIPKDRGLYVFTVELSPAKLPRHGYILYAGITGDVSKAHLHARYGQYLLNLRNGGGRPAVLFMLENWSGHLFFNFVPLPNKTVDLANLERNFIKAIIPPINKRDFGAKIGNAKAAAF